MIRDDSGFTLPEVLVTMVLLAIVLGAFGSMLITSSKTSNRVEEQAALQADVRASLDRMTSDFRQATTAGVATPVESVSATAFTFDSPDRGTPFHLRRIAYQLVNGQLQRSTTISTNTGSSPWSWPLTAASWISEVGSITNASPFTFYDSTGAVTTNALTVHSMRVTLTVGPRQTQGGTNTYSTTIAIRTLQ
jgi:prepilin-type N-terminal cleavage/methylation domain-containing protein